MQNQVITSSWRGRRYISVAAMAALIVFSSFASAQIGASGSSVNPGSKVKAPPPVRIEQVGSWGGPVNCFAREGNVGVVGSGERLVVLDMSDPMNLVELGSVRLGSTLRDVAFRDGFAYAMTAGVDWKGIGNHLGGRGPHVVD